MQTLTFSTLSGARFAAANSYGGFVSDFSKIFATNNFERIYILKGGPGTGKSTLLKRLYGAFSNRASCEAIYCSSDPYSLDGIIISTDKKIAVIDGTSPHMTDPYLPGAVEEIVNLGDGFDIPKLKGARDNIAALSKRKSIAYASAYSHLRLAGEIDKEIERIYLDSANYYEAEKILSKFIDTSECDFCGAWRISAFCKLGHVCLPQEAKNKTSVIGDGYSEILFMRLLAQALKERGMIRYICPSPLNPSQTDALYTSDKLIYIGNEKDADIDTRVLAPSEKEPLTTLIKIRTELLGLARCDLLRAAQEHASLEKIYTSAMNFKCNDEKCAILTEACEHTLFS